MNQAATITRPEFATTDALAASVNRLAQPALPDPLDAGIAHAVDTLLAQQQADGHWVYELEADATIPAEYILMVHYLGEQADPVLEGKIANYLRRIQNADGGWPLFHAGASDISASVKGYFALKMAGDDPEAAHMRRARAAIHGMGGAEASNVFTRTLLALYGVMPWQAVPMMPVEIMLLPQWFPFHLSKVSYWARTVIVPLLVLNSLRPRARNPRKIGIDELFLRPAQSTRLPARAPHQSPLWVGVFRALDAVVRVAEPLFPRSLRARAIERARTFTVERLNGEDGLGAIFPAMVNSVLMFDVLGVPESDPNRAIARRSIDKLLVVRDDEAYCQPCLSPVWDTSLASHALLEVGEPRAIAAAVRGLDWLVPLQELDLQGDWIVRRPDVRPGGWAFQYANAHYPDVDDTAVVAAAMDRADKGDRTDRYKTAVARACEWVVGMQSSNGGWGAFEPENTHLYLNNIPFADHGALLDPPTADVSARCLAMLCQLGQMPANSEPAARALRYLLDEQEADGSWFGRWGTNYIYGTWSALCGLNAAGIGANAPEVQRAAKWLLSIQNPDGGWGESGDSYKIAYRGYERAPSTASQTAWAMLGLMAAGAGDHPAVVRGVEFLLRTQASHGFWDEPYFTAVGFPRVFYLRYHGYARFFPLWALARFRNLLREGNHAVAWGL
ncbi:squalene-hopene/tetraprenyl-beta-curcumene cyclase [Cupriavidus sp. OV038]|jgi:squalene-hopene/tetraprenyl-beta-curcumene cyclase|uniref:squalene--hopene cyclase n=1 Tax=unclassified Cupriavidus TaxID=2640874 RepID=UPI0008E76609|nr:MULTISPECIES: squalene--hopene cyclase [unclassified Cupriavidus]SFC99502.1 squalene-hopene/tetraprenyl-beta-curcumene cyclase [Cupriavidus sp. OV038]SFP61791.1 squalene-hopene/tetraprenyl-beta-curcumene cyclase [Cupriavidus sp. OV096]